MVEYITRDDAVHLIFIAATSGRTAGALKMLRECIVTDVVEVVRCENCKHMRTISGEGWGIDAELYYCGENEILVSPVGYCSDGDRMDGDQQ